MASRGKSDRDETGHAEKKLIWLPCVASGIRKSNISAKLVALVTDKRRKFERGAGRAMAAGAFQEYPSDATDTKEYRQNTAEAGASEIHFVFDAPKRDKRHRRYSNEPRTVLRKH